jgi:hypothetical protein
MSEAVIGLAGALVGACVAFLGQLITARATDRADWRRTVHTQCALIYALEREAGLGAWEVYRGRAAGRVDNWDFMSRRMAEAQVLLVTRDRTLITAMSELTDAGVRMAAEIRHVREDPERDRSVLRHAIGRHSAAAAAFGEAARVTLGVRESPARQIEGSDPGSPELDWVRWPRLEERPPET